MALFLRDGETPEYPPTLRVKIPVKDGENIDRALKRFKRKFLQTQVLKEIRQRKEFTKKSEKLRVKKQKAVFSENLLRNTK